MNSILLYDPRTNNIVTSIDFSDPVTALDFRSDGTTVAMALVRHGVYVYDIRKFDKPVYLGTQGAADVKVLKFQPRFVNDEIAKKYAAEGIDFRCIPREWEDPVEEIIDSAEVEVVEDQSISSDAGIDLEEIRRTVMEIEQDFKAHEPTLSAKNAAFLKTARDIYKAEDKISLMDEPNDFLPKKQPTPNKPEESFSQSVEMARLISLAFSRAFGELQDEISLALNQVHLDILKRISDVSHKMKTLQTHK
jgi:hypothetical protein